MSYQEYLKMHIFDQLEMKDSGYDFYDEIILNRANCYSKKNDKIYNAEFVDMRIAGGGGGLYSTILDLFKFNVGLFDCKLIDKKSL